MPPPDGRRVVGNESAHHPAGRSEADLLRPIARRGEDPGLVTKSIGLDFDFDDLVAGESVDDRQASGIGRRGCGPGQLGGDYARLAIEASDAEVRSGDRLAIRTFDAETCAG